jgi:hypothetical protein
MPGGRQDPAYNQQQPRRMDTTLIELGGPLRVTSWFRPRFRLGSTRIAAAPEVRGRWRVRVLAGQAMGTDATLPMYRAVSRCLCTVRSAETGGGGTGSLEAYAPRPRRVGDGTRPANPEQYDGCRQLIAEGIGIEP